MATRPKIFGHRGSMATHPENTLPGFLYAIEAGADGVELDIAVGPGESLLVTHDPPVTGRDYPSLDDVLALDAPQGFVFDIEAKGIVSANLLLDVIRRSPQHRLIVRSFLHDNLRALHAIAPEITLAALIESRNARDWTEIANAAGASIISPHYSVATREKVARAHAAGIGVSVWTVNEPADWRRMADMGVDFIITNDPAAAVRYFK
jgi:glycerophosphoryl diester phosphodiesterase